VANVKLFFSEKIDFFFKKNLIFYKFALLKLLSFSSFVKLAHIIFLSLKRIGKK